MSLHGPSAWFLLALLLVPLAVWTPRRRRGALPYPVTSGTLLIPRGLIARTAWIVPMFRVIGLIALIVALARPQKADEQTRVRTEGVAISLVVDRSGSMVADDFVLNGRKVTRLEVVKNVVEEFVTGGEELGGRPSDLLGVVAFGTYADSICPLTTDHRHVVDSIRSIRIPRSDDEKATAIGDAIALAVERINRLDERMSREEEQRIRGKVIVLLTDGAQTAGEIDPLVAAELARTYDIRIYTIGAGSERGTIGQGLMRRRVGIDEDTLRAVAAATGGEYFRAKDAEALRGVYSRIDELERSELTERRFTDYHELAVRPTAIGSFTLPPILAVALVAFLFETLLATTRYRRLA